MTQAQRVLDDLRRGPVDVRDYPAGFRLAARVWDLRQAGHVIDEAPLALPSGSTVAQYRMSPSTPAVAAPAAAPRDEPDPSGVDIASSEPAPFSWTCVACGSRPATEPEPLLGGMGMARCIPCDQRRVFARKVAA